ncbi:MAG: hypothetical protein ACTHK3_11505 [Solirubrobacterales bacterium]
MQIDLRFGHVDQKLQGIDGRFDRMEGEFKTMQGDIKTMQGEINQRFDSVHHLMFLGIIAICGAIVTGIVGVLGFVAMQV